MFICPFVDRLCLQQVCQCFCCFSIVGNESSIIACHSQECLELFDGFDIWPVGDCFDLLGIHADSFRANAMSKVVSMFLHKEALLLFRKNLVFSHNDENLLQMFEVFFFRIAVDSQIVDVDYHEETYEGSKYIIYKLLESGWCILEAKRHDLEVVLSSLRARCAECCHFLAVVSHGYLVKSAE